LAALAVVQAVIERDRVPEPDPRSASSSMSARDRRAKEANHYIQFNLTFCV